MRCSPVAAVRASILHSLCRCCRGRQVFEVQHCHAGLGVAISNHRTEPLISILPSLNSNVMHISIFSLWIWTKLSHLIAVTTLFIRSLTAVPPSYLQTGLFVIQDQANWFFSHLILHKSWTFAVNTLGWFFFFFPSLFKTEWRLNGDLKVLRLTRWNVKGSVRKRRRTVLLKNRNLRQIHCQSYKSDSPSINPTSDSVDNSLKAITGYITQLIDWNIKRKHKCNILKTAVPCWDRVSLDNNCKHE